MLGHVTFYPAFKREVGVGGADDTIDSMASRMLLAQGEWRIICGSTDNSLTSQQELSPQFLD